MKIAGLFSGIGGLELAFHQAGHEPTVLCDNWQPAQRVLRDRFPGVPLETDVRELADRGLPGDVDVITAGFPCTDLSQAGRTAGIHGRDSGLVAQVFRLLERHRGVTWLVLENVRNMLVLDRGTAMKYLTDELASLGFRWAYRLVDSRFTGVPQRRQRVILVASRTEDPRTVVFADDAGDPGEAHLHDDMFGFYWTEGLRGLGWAKDAVPPLKGGSGVGIPSPPAVWIPGAARGRRLVSPTIQDAEALQGFQRHWTSAAEVDGRNGPRWKLVGNAVTVGVTRWLTERLETPGDYRPTTITELPVGSRWPTAAWGDADGLWEVGISMWPKQHPYQHLSQVMDTAAAVPLTYRAASGFFDRTQRSQLRFTEEFLLDVKDHVAFTKS